jgi:hypothetical protein
MISRQLVMVYFEASVADQHSHSLSSVTAGKSIVPSGHHLFFVAFTALRTHCAPSRTIVMYARWTCASFEMIARDLLGALRRQSVPINSFTNRCSLLELVQYHHLLGVHAILATAVAR